MVIETFGAGMRPLVYERFQARGQKFRATAEQVLNHILPALAGIKPNLTVKVEHDAVLK